MSALDAVARAIMVDAGCGMSLGDERVFCDDQRLPTDVQGRYCDCRSAARVAIQTLREMTLVYRDGGQVVHEMRGAPDDIWKTLLDAALADHINPPEASA